MKKSVQISIRTRVNTTELERGRALVALLESHGMTPEQVSFNPDKFKDDVLGDESLERGQRWLPSNRRAGALKHHFVRLAAEQGGKVEWLRAAPNLYPCREGGPRECQHLRPVELPSRLGNAVQ